MDQYKKGFFTILSVVVLALLSACQQPVPTGIGIQRESEPVVQIGVSEVVDVAAPAQLISCGAPSAAEVNGCREMEERILASTVRIVFHGPVRSTGHATVIGGRYLVTHNHYHISGAALANGGNSEVTAVSLFKADGDLILLRAPLTAFTVAAEKPETLILDFMEESGIGFFDSLGVPSAESKGLDALSLEVGREVAQIDWDGATAHVDWVRVTAVDRRDDTFYLELDNFVEQGASGGGVFYEGAHIANNWLRNTDRAADSGELLRQYSVAALN